MRYLITGGAGFIGSHLCESLLVGGHKVVVLDDFSTGSFDNIAHLEDNACLEVVCASVNDQQLVRDYVKEVDRVYHLASAVGVQLIMDEPVTTIETIVGGTSSVLAACARYRRPVLITSTSEVYGKSQSVPFAEDDDSVIGPPHRRRWAYASAKALDEFLAMAHWHHSRVPVVIVRFFNTVGPRQTGQYGMVIPRFVKQAMAGDPITVYGDGTQTRCFCHVRDTVWAVNRLMDDASGRGQVFNIGSDHEININELAERIRYLTKSDSSIRHIPFAEAYDPSFEDMARRIPDLTKINRFIGFRPQHSLDDILANVIDYTRQLGSSDRQLATQPK